MRKTSFSPDHTALTAQTFTSTKPIGNATARITSSVMSVGTFDACFGHDTHSEASGRSVWRSMVSVVRSTRCSAVKR